MTSPGQRAHQARMARREAMARALCQAEHGHPDRPSRHADGVAQWELWHGRAATVLDLFDRLAPPPSPAQELP